MKTKFKKLSDSRVEITVTLDAKDLKPAADKALEKLAKIDWSNYDAIKDAKKIMASYGITIDETSGRWAQFAQEMRSA